MEITVRQTWMTIWLIAATLIVATGGCDTEALLNQSAVFGPSGATAQAGAPLASGGRGTFRVLIENNTPFRAIFTTGVFDNTDERSTPIFVQYSPDSMLTFPGSTTTLEDNSNTGILQFPCARAFSVGSRSLIKLVDKNPGAFADVIDEAGLLDGVGFSSQTLATDDAAIPREGFARGFEALLGVDFNCGSLLHVTLEFAAVGPDRFLVNLAEVFPAGRDQP